MRLLSPKSPLLDALQLIAYNALFWATAAVIWAWTKVGVPIEVQVAGYIAAFFGLLGLAFLCAEQDIKLFRRMRAQWRHTFPRRR